MPSRLENARPAQHAGQHGTGPGNTAAPGGAGDDRRFRISVDTGGTFTDVVVATPAGSLTFDKALTNLDDPWQSLSEAFRILESRLQLGAGELLRRTSLLFYATTRATNAILERTTARTAFFTTEGFPDILSLREGGRTSPFEFHREFPEPYVPRSLTWELPGRMDSDGRELRALDRDAVERAVDSAIGRGCQAIGVCLLWSPKNPAHEIEAGKIIESRAAGISCTLSHALNPIVREYRRASSTVIDASLKPLMQAHYLSLIDSLRQNGFAGEMLAVTSTGGCLPVSDIIDQPIHTVASGPSMAPVAARAFAAAEPPTCESDLIVCDAGGTSFDVSLVRDNELAITRERWLGPRFQGHMTGVAGIAVESIGAGGGSIAWIDRGGRLCVGPQSAGADPGPACYGRDGTRPTVTDAAAVLGYLDSGFFLGGRLKLLIERSLEAIETQIATPLGMPAAQAAEAILTVAAEAMVDVVREITVNQGVDPRHCVLVSGGGAGGLLAVTIARALKIRHVLAPHAAGALSAAGAQFSDVVAEFSRSAVMSSERFDAGRCQATLTAIDALMTAVTGRVAAEIDAVGGIRREYFTEARYPHQVWDLRIPVAWTSGQPLTEQVIDQATELFHQTHRRVFAVSDDSSPVEFQQWGARFHGELPRPSVVRRSLAGGHSEHGEQDAGHREPGAVQERSARFGGRDWATPCYRGAGLPAGSVIAGPAIIEDATSTLVLPPGSAVTVSASGSYLVDTRADGQEAGQ